MAHGHSLFPLSFFVIISLYYFILAFTPAGLPLRVGQAWAALFRRLAVARSTKPHHLQRITGRGDLHFITFTCYQRRKFLASPRNRNLVAQILGELRRRFEFALVGYVLMPDHVHLILSEPPGGSPAKVIQVFKQGVSRKLRPKRYSAKAQLRLPFAESCDPYRRFWQRRYYDFNIYTRRNLREKLDYMHANPVRGKLVTHPQDWPWSSWSFYAGKEALLPIDVWN
jgi:putative transposase